MSRDIEINLPKHWQNCGGCNKTDVWVAYFGTGNSTPVPVCVECMEEAIKMIHDTASLTPST